MWIDLCDCTNGLCSTFPKHHPCVWMQILWVLDESEATGGLVPCPEVFFVHEDDGGSLLGAATVNCVYMCMYTVYVHVDRYPCVCIQCTYPLLGTLC